MNSYITLLSSEDYLPGTRALIRSIEITQPRYPIAVLVSQNVSPALLDDLNVTVIPLIKTTAQPRFLSNHYWDLTFDKLQIFDQIQYDKLVYLDSDIHVLANLDHLFDKPHISAVVDTGRKEKNTLCGGLMVVNPEEGLHDKLVEFYDRALEKNVRRIAIGDQELINSAYPDWFDNKDRVLDDSYAVFSDCLDSHIAGGGQKPRTIHFAGKIKPWFPFADTRHEIRTRPVRDKTVHERAAFKRYLDLIHSVNSKEETCPM